jgi:hypothetical protein
VGRSKRRSFTDVIRAWQNRNVVGDDFRVSVVCLLPDSALTPWMVARGYRPGRSNVAPVSFSLPSVAFSAKDGEERQQRFEETLEAFRFQLRESGVDSGFIAQNDASVKVYTTLSPVIGFADVFLFPPTLDLWRPLNTTFHFDVIGADLRRARKGIPQGG